MHTSDRVPQASLPGPSLLHAARRAARIAAWDLSGVLVARYYQHLLRRHGHSPQALAERADDKDFQFYRHLFREVAVPAHLSVLDIGCGMGDLIEFLRLNDHPIESYLGIDLVGPFIDHCRRAYRPPCRFQQINFVSSSFAPAERFNLVVAMGVLVSRVYNYEAYVEYCIEKMIALSTKYVLFNLITEVDLSLGNYKGARRIGSITYMPKCRLTEILTRVASRAPIDFAIHDVRIYPDALDTFIRITIDG